MKHYVYVASSWRNPIYDAMMATMKTWGHDFYDFKNPEPGAHGFSWRETDDRWPDWEVADYLKALEHPTAARGFAYDFAAMRRATAAVLILPCGRSAHLELGWFIGRGIPTCIYLPNEKGFEPELMYKMASKITTSVDGVKTFLDSDESGKMVPVGIALTTEIVPPGRRTTLNLECLHLFKPQKVFFDNNPSFVVESILCGEYEQLGQTPLPATAFYSELGGIEAPWDSVEAGQYLTLAIRNTSASPSRISAVITGFEVEY